MTEKIQKEEIFEETLEQVSGGSWANSDSDYASGSTPRYSMGQTVYRSLSQAQRQGNHPDRGVIIDITKDKNGNYKKSGLINKEFTYTVRYDNGEVEDDIYESQLYLK